MDRRRGRKYYLACLNSDSHNYRVEIIKCIPSVKISPIKSYMKIYGHYQMLVGCDKRFTKELEYELYNCDWRKI